MFITAYRLKQMIGGATYNQLGALLTSGRLSEADLRRYYSRARQTALKRIKAAEKAGLQGRVIATFVVMKDGSTVKADIVFVGSTDKYEFDYCDGDCGIGSKARYSDKVGQVAVFMDGKVSFQPVTDICVDTTTVKDLDLGDKPSTSSIRSRVVKKGATKLVKGFSNVPTFVLEYLLGTYCASDSDADIDAGIEQVKQILTNNYVRNDEVELVKSRIRENGSYNVIDVVDARFDERKNLYWAHLHNMGITNVIPDEVVKSNERLLSDGIWCIVELSYQFDEDEGGEFVIDGLTPIQMPGFDLQEIVSGNRDGRR